jgi:hypothetical protein
MVDLLNQKNLGYSLLANEHNQHIELNNKSPDDLPRL